MTKAKTNKSRKAQLKELRRDLEQTKAAAERIYEAYLDGPYKLTPKMLADRISEYDSASVYYLIQRLQGMAGFYSGDSDSAREYQVQESRQQWLYSPLGQWCVNVWTSYGLGESVKVTPNEPDEAAKEAWDYAWDNSQIFDDDQIHDLSNFTLVDGEIYLAAFISIAGDNQGKVIFRQLKTDEISEIVTNPDDCSQPLYYKREYSDKDNNKKCYYYPDWYTYFYHPDAFEKYTIDNPDAYITVSESMEEMNGTTTLVLHIAHNRKDSASLHGWPILGIAAPYLRAHKQFMEDRLTVSKQKAMFVRNLTVDGGSRAVKATAARFDSQLGSSSASAFTDPNPPAIAGSTYAHNRAEDYEDLPMTTGAGDANTDNNMFAWMALLGPGLFPTSAGLDTSRWATAVAMDKTQAVQWSRYQTFWASQFEKMVELVLLADEYYNNNKKVKWEDKGCKVSIDTLSLVDFPGVVQPISSMLNAVRGMIADGTITEQAGRKIAQAYIMPTLTALGAENVDEIMSDEILEILTPEERKKARKEAEEAKKQLVQNPPPAPEQEQPEEPTEEARKYWGSMANNALKIYEDNRKEKAGDNGKQAIRHD